MDFPASPLLSAEEAHRAFLELADGYDELAITNRKQARQAWFKALLALSSSSSYHTSSSEVVAVRSKVWDVVLHARQADPDLFSFPIDAPAPFTEKEAAQKTPGGHSLPSPSEWKALLASQKMDRDLAATEPAAPRRPRM